MEEDKKEVVADTSAEEVETPVVEAPEEGDSKEAEEKA